MGGNSSRHLQEFFWPKTIERSRNSSPMLRPRALRISPQETKSRDTFVSARQIGQVVPVKVTSFARPTDEAIASSNRAIEPLAVEPSRAIENGADERKRSPCTAEAPVGRALVRLAPRTPGASQVAAQVKTAVRPDELEFVRSPT